MKRPSFQFYPADWRNNAKLRRCSEAARGAWMDVLCLLHDSDEYGVCRWPLADLARAGGVPVKLLTELIAKDVLKGSDSTHPGYIYTPRHAGRDGPPVALVPASDGPCWYSTRLVRDEWVRLRRGGSTRFCESDDAPKPSPKWLSKSAPKATPNSPIGDSFGDGTTSTSSSSSATSLGSPPTQPAATATPERVSGGGEGGSGYGEGVLGANMASVAPSPYGRICRAIRAAGISNAHPERQDFRVLVDAGADEAEFLQYVPAALKNASEPFAYLISAVKNERARAKDLVPRLHAGPMPETKPSTRKPSTHSGFAQKDYRSGVDDDGYILAQA